MEYEGPRERLLAKGAASLSDVELVSVLLGTGPAGATAGHRGGSGARELARAVLARSGGIDGLLNATCESLASVRGIGPTKLARLLAVRELAVRLCAAREDGEPIESAEAAYSLFRDLALEEQEVVAAAFLTARHRVIRRAVLFRGALDSAVARPREILREALRANAAKCLVAHNHPSESTEPSPEDLDFTARLSHAARAVGVPLLDHLIVCRGGRYYSFAAAGTLGA